MTDYRAHGWRTVAADKHDQARRQGRGLHRQTSEHVESRTRWRQRQPATLVHHSGRREDSGKATCQRANSKSAISTIEVLARAVTWLENYGEPAAALKLLDIMEEWEVGNRCHHGSRDSR